MALATVTRDGLIYTVTLSERADACLARWATSNSRNRANQLEDIIQAFLRNKINDYRNADGPSLAAQLAAMTPEQRAIVDPVFAAVVIPPE